MTILMQFQKGLGQIVMRAKIIMIMVFALRQRKMAATIEIQGGQGCGASQKTPYTMNVYINE